MAGKIAVNAVWCGKCDEDTTKSLKAFRSSVQMDNSELIFLTNLQNVITSFLTPLRNRNIEDRLKIPVYIINPDCSNDRFQKVSRSADGVGQDYHLVSAAHGNKIDFRISSLMNIKRFCQQHGKKIRFYEAGCYFCHLRRIFP